MVAITYEPLQKKDYLGNAKYPGEKKRTDDTKVPPGFEA